MKLWVSMGLKPSGDPAEPLRPCLRVVDTDVGRVVDELRHTCDPAHVAGPGAHQEFTAGAFLPDGRLIQPAHTELLWIDPHRMRIERVVSHPLFHGMHSATASPEGLVVTCAGTESVLELDPRGELSAHHWLRPGRFGYPGITDFRTVDHDALKPHSHHPNHAARVGGDLWVTCFETADCRSLGADRRIDLAEAIPHDGRLRGGLLWFTQVVGVVIGVDPATLAREVVIDLRALDRRGSLGWCRGVEVVGSRLFVGMTMLRATRHREALRQIVYGQKRPTRVVEVDLDRAVIVGEIEVGNAAGGTIYSVNAC